MEFRFNVSDIFREPIVEINSNMLPPGFSGDRRAMWDAITRTTEIVNAMGEASARAQGLTKPITTAERLRNSEQQRLYLLVDRDARNGKGVVTGMLKTGNKGLYIFDRDGHHYQVTPPCVLDFYVHESRQRSGLGKQLFEHMLQKEKIEPVKIAIDRPSDKFLGFLNKHYRLNSPIKQMNNFVVFDGFFPDSQNKEKNGDSGTPVKSGATSAKTIANGLQSYTSPLGRYGAPRPPCSMGQIIHNQSPTVPQAQESASCPGRLNQVQSNYNPPIPRQAYSSYETNVSSGVPNEIQNSALNSQIQYAHGDVQQQQHMHKSEDGGFPTQNYQPTLNTQQQFHNAQAQNYQPYIYNTTNPVQSQQMLQNNVQYTQQMQLPQQEPSQVVQQVSNQQQQMQPKNIVQGQYIQPQHQVSYRNELQLGYAQQQPAQQNIPYLQQSTSQLQTNNNYVQHQIPQQPIYMQQMPNVSSQPELAYQPQNLQPQFTVSTPQLQTPQHTVGFNQLQQPQMVNSQQTPPQQIPNIQQQYYPSLQNTMQAQPHLATAISNATQQVQSQQSATTPNILTIQPQQQFATSVPNMQPVNVHNMSTLPVTSQSTPTIGNNALQPAGYANSLKGSNIHDPTTHNTVPNQPEYVSYSQNIQEQNLQKTRTDLAQAVSPQQAFTYIQQVPQPVAETMHTQQSSQMLPMTTTSQVNTNIVQQIGDNLQQTQVPSEQTQKYQYYDSSTNEIRLGRVQNIEADGVAKKPSASGDRNLMSTSPSTYELEYPPQARETLGTPNRHRR